MGPKNQKTSGGGSSSRNKAQDDEKEDVLQAVLIADTFETTFAPFTLEKPRCLLQLANIPLIDYTLDFLARSGVQEVFISASSHTDQVERYIDESSRSTTRDHYHYPFKRLTFLKSAATSVGDVMRDLDQKGLVSGDFLVVSGDVVSNFPIAEAMVEHKARRQRDKNAIMTMLLREMGCNQPASERRSSPVFVVDPTKNRCLHYEERTQAGGTDTTTTTTTTTTSSIKLDPEMLTHPELEIRQDLIDCRIDICCPEMLSLWSDNFDNQSLRKDFLHGILKDYELNGKTVHTHIFNDHFANRARDLSTYDRLSREICSRWSFPDCPDAGDRYRFSPTGFYREDGGVKMARSCRVGSGSIVGHGTEIGEKSSIHASVIGRHCRIGRNVEIRHAHIWDRAVIEDDAKILRAIIADGAVVGHGSKVQNGSLISFGVRIGPSQNIDHGSRITKVPMADGRSKPSNKDVVGDSGEGHLYEDEDGDEAESEPRSSGLVYQHSAFASSESSISTSAGTERSTDPSRHVGGSRSGSFATTMSDEDGTDRFHHEAVVSLFERMRKSTHQDDVHVELMSLRFAQNATGYQVRRAVAVALVKYISHRIDSNQVSAADAVKQSIASYRKLVRRDDSQETGPAQVEFLLEAQKDLVHRKGGDQILLHVLKELYDQDVFEEDVIDDWWHDDRSKGSDELRRTRESSKQLMDWLANADEETDSGSDEG